MKATAALPPPLRSAGARLYGRDEDLTRLRAKLATGARLVTLFGPAGIGKTTLGKELARLATGDARPPVIADLAEVRDKSGACSALGRALGVPFDPRREAASHLEMVLRAHGQHVVVLDACDRAVEPVAELLRGWLAAGVPTVFVVTSRELLGLLDEHAYEVGPLSVPGPDEQHSDAVALFLARAEQTRHEALRAVDPEVVADIVRALEGIPLALELAAGRLSVLTPVELRTRLTSRLGVLTSRLRTEHPRQRTMRAAIEWSWSQLEPHEQTALRQLSIFRGGFDAEAAEAVLDLSAHPDAPRVIDVLQSLRAKSFIRGDETAGDVRLGLYEILREFGAQALVDAGEEGGTAARHAAYFVEQSRTWASAMAPADQGAAIARLASELHNLLAAHARALDGQTAGGVGDAYRVLVNLEPVIWSGLPTHGALALMDRTLAQGEPAPDASAELRCQVLLLRARTLQLMGRPEAGSSAQEALSLARAEGCIRLEGDALARLGSIDVSDGEVRRGSDRLREAVSILTEQDPRLAANALKALGISLRTLGELEEARMAHEEGLAIRARIGDDRSVGVDTACLGAVHFQQGDVEKARLLLEESIERSARFDDHYSCAYAIGILGTVLAELGHLDEATLRLKEARRKLEKLGERRLNAMFVGYSAVVHQLAGRLDEADAAYRSSIGTLRELGDRLHEGLFSGAAATLQWAKGEPALAERLFGVARARLTELSTSVNARLSTALSLHLGHQDLWSHRSALASGDERLARTHLDSARQRYVEASAAVEHHDDLRLAHRLLQKALDGELQARTKAGEIEVDGHAMWFRVAGKARVDLRRRRSLRLILKELVDERVRAPGAPVAMARLLAAGWPGEKMMLQAGLSRLYVTVRSLRELGLRSALLRQDDGYLLDPGVRLVGSEVPAPLGEAAP